MKTKEEILELIQECYFQQMMSHITFEKSHNSFEKRDIEQKSRYTSGMIAAYTYVLSGDNEREYNTIKEQQQKLAFERFSQISVVTDKEIESVQKSFHIYV